MTTESIPYDEARGIASIHATHLSTYCGFPIQNENTKNAMIAYISSMSIADGVGNSYMKNSIGTVGEIMNTNWGKAGSMPKWFRNYRGTAVEVPMTDKLKSVYPYNDINRIGNNITRMNIALSSFKIINHAINKDSTSAAWEASQYRGTILRNIRLRGVMSKGTK